MKRGLATLSVVGLALAIAGGVNAVAAENDGPPVVVVVAEPVDLTGNPITDAGEASSEDEPDAPADAEQDDSGDGGGSGGKAARDVRVAAELEHARGSKKSKDSRGYMESLYQGKWYMPKKEKRRKCIIDREAKSHYKAVNRTGKYRGAYQMNRALAIGSTYMMMPEVRKDFGKEGVKMVKELRTKPTQQWNRYWQDRSFWVLWRKGKGAFHWANGAWHC